MVHQFTFNLYSILLHVIVDVNNDLNFFSAFLELQSIRDYEATASKELIFFNALTDVQITSRKTRFAVANSGKTMTFYESIGDFSENIRRLPFSIIRTTDYSKGFLRSPALRIIEV